MAGDAEAAEDASDNSSESSDEVQAPLAKALMVADGDKKAAKPAESDTDQDAIDDAEECLDCYASFTDFGDDKNTWVDQEQEMPELHKRIGKMVPVARNKSLVHMAKNLMQYHTMLKCAILVRQKARQYKNKKGSDAVASAFLATIQLVKDKCPLVIHS